MTRVAVTVPASSANLGPGFDALALGHELRNEIVADTEEPSGVAVEGEGKGELPEDSSNVVFQAMAHLAREVGIVLPPLGLACTNRIPLERGLGSSAAAVVGGVLLADRLLGAGLEADRLLGIAVDLEGHPDNVAACLRGGLALVYLSHDGWRVETLATHAGLRPVLLVPENERVATIDARGVLPLEVPLSDAAFNGGRTALALLALTARPDLLDEALEDRLHQQRRLDLAPASRALFQDLRDAGVPVCVSGAGPSLLAFETETAPVPELGPGWRVERPGIAREGAIVREIS